MSLWRRLGVDQTSDSIINRYQHLMFTVGPVEAPSGFLLYAPYPDVVRVAVNPERFDFGLTGAGMIAAPDTVAGMLEQNSSIQNIYSGNGWSWFEVRGRGN